jgi:hypothetical protein
MVGLETLWRFSLAYNLWQASHLYKRLYQETDVIAMEREVETIMRTMTAVWRQAGVVVVLSLMEKTTKALRYKIPFVDEILLSLLGVALVSTVFLSRKETETLALAEYKSKKRDELPRDRLIRHGRVTLRAMSFCSAAFLLDALFLGLIALSQDSWSVKALKLIHLPTPLGLGTLLWTLRKAFGKGLKVLTHSSNKNFVMTSKTGMELQKATVSFWTKAKRTIRLQVVLTAGAAILSLVKTH